MKIKDFSAGDSVEIVTDSATVKGIVMPNETENIVIKLDSGYNFGIERKKIKSIKLLEKHTEAKEEKKEKVKSKKDLKNITILHTGGTIASKVDYTTGGVVSRFEPHEIIEMFPELRDIFNVDSRLIGNMWSEDMRFIHFQKIAKEIIKEIKNKKDGVIVTLGTDFMAYASAAVSFMLQNIPIPVIFVGAQRSSDRGSSDAAMNLICAAEFIRQTNFTGHAICMHETQDDINCLILHPCTSRKMHSSRRDAFRPINNSAIARVNYEKRTVNFIDEKYENKKKSDGKFSPKINMEEKVALIKVHPNMFPEQFKAFKGYKGLVIEGSGLGHAPVGVPDKDSKKNEDNFKEIKKLIKSGTVVIMATQTIYGAVQMQVYAKGRDLVSAGIIPCKALAETSLIKLSWLIANFSKEMKDHEKAKELIERDFCGEMFYRIEDQNYLN